MLQASSQPAYALVGGCFHVGTSYAESVRSCVIDLFATAYHLVCVVVLLLEGMQWESCRACSGEGAGGSRDLYQDAAGYHSMEFKTLGTTVYLLFAACSLTQGSCSRTGAVICCVCVCATDPQ
jgi:hypothetical protein